MVIKAACLRSVRNGSAAQAQRIRERTVESSNRATEFTKATRRRKEGGLDSFFMKPHKISASLLISASLVSIVAASVAISLVGRQPNSSVLLPNGQTIPPAGAQIEVNDRPLGIAVSPDGTQAAVATASNFARRALHIIDRATATLAQTIAIGNSFVGVAFTPDGNTLYVGGGADNDVKIFTKGVNSVWTQAPRIAISSAA